MSVEKIKLVVEPGAGRNGSLAKASVPTNSTPSISALFHIDVGILRGFRGNGLQIIGMERSGQSRRLSSCCSVSRSMWRRSGIVRGLARFAWGCSSLKSSQNHGPCAEVTHIDSHLVRASPCWPISPPDLIASASILLPCSPMFLLKL